MRHQLSKSVSQTHYLSPDKKGSGRGFSRISQENQQDQIRRADGGCGQRLGKLGGRTLSFLKCYRNANGCFFVYSTRNMEKIWRTLNAEYWRWWMPSMWWVKIWEKQNLFKEARSWWTVSLDAYRRGKVCVSVRVSVCVCLCVCVSVCLRVHACVRVSLRT